MPDTFPIKCFGCDEIFDALLANADDMEPYPCPTCGFSMLFSSRADFVLLQPEEVIIDEQTSQRLRFRLPRYLRGSEQQAVNYGMMVMGVVAFGIGVAGTIYRFRDGDLFEMFFGVAAIGGGFTMIALAVFNLRAHILVDLSYERIIVGYQLGPWNIHKQYPLPAIQDVFMKSTTPGFRLFGSDDCTACVKTPSRTIQMADSRYPDPARYVTHLLRQQLIAMQEDH